ncbi:3-oxoacyl-(acyl-carrier-protein) synthase [Anseongella ginsenosidimutans]|uniref:3-oxoacyl-(Acyl-carrier-protein) synthase n=1 Tax=Anseongella ginsenosidimutans TaxID=496056 RepID=A0A4R3KV00_9SPHI|nr:beta-ketoacyl synthase N-terminal-like domain-containing protein [Anseongella ginsenosidimutans]QEC53073.1 beta-ketoacyl synthase [Anseongella ginsenosidimutans]TCS87687.1 3-oxoacyl-(acyl-carrier-protein) synthase [Anseongella ginsenosidimutans]
MERIDKIGIAAWGSISALGINGEGAWERYRDNAHCFTKAGFSENSDWIAPLSGESQSQIDALAEEKLKYQQLDPSVRYAIAASRNAVQQAGWVGIDDLGINIGSSRGATTAFEKYHEQFLENGRQFTDPLTSPGTTLGNIAGWAASDLNVSGPAISHSITCSTAMHSIINAVVWLRSGHCTRFLAGGSEAPLTPFTLAQMKALKVYSRLDDQYPCRSMDLEKTQSSMILGEGAACFCLEKDTEGALAYVSGIGYGTEVMTHGASLSADALCLQRSMKMALNGHDPESVSAVVLHAPGTIRGDMAELEAIKAVFGTHKPLLTSNKWKIGHTFGASGALSMEMALLMLLHDQFIQPPYLAQQRQTAPLKKILVNGVGFGGNAASILMER